MSSPLFSVGEEVIVLPGIRQEYINCIRISSDPYHHCETAVVLGIGRIDGYPEIVYSCSNEPVWWVGESCLRKKPPLGDSFDQIITDLKNPSHVGVPA